MDVIHRELPGSGKAAASFSGGKQRWVGGMFCAEIVGNVHWLGGEAAAAGSVPSAVTGLQARVSR